MRGQPKAPLVCWPAVHPHVELTPEPDGLVCRIVVFGAPRTKKNHGQIITVRGRPKMLPSKPFLAWERDAGIYVARSTGQLVRWEPSRHKRPLLPDGMGFNIAARFYREVASGDACGFYQGVADLLQHHRLVADDKQFVSWDGSRLRKDRDLPRVVCDITDATD